MDTTLFKRIFNLKLLRHTLLTLACSAVAFATNRIMLYFNNSFMPTMDDPYLAKVYLFIAFTLNLAALIGFCVLVFHYFDNVDLFAKKEYFTSDNRTPLLYQSQYIIPSALSLVISPFIFCEGYNFLLRFFWADSPIFLGYILSLLTFIAMRVIMLISLRSKWENEIKHPDGAPQPLFKRNSDMNNFKLKQLIIQPAGYSVILFGASLLFSLALIVLKSIIIMLFSLLTDGEWATWIFGIIVLFTFLPVVIGFVHNLRVRIKLLNILKRLEKDKIAEVTFDGHKYLSAFFPSLIFNVKIKRRTDGKVFNCCVVTCGKMGAPMYFREREFLVERGFRIASGALLARGGSFGYAVDVSKMGGNENPTNMIFGYKKGYDLIFPEIEGDKIIIINPTPKKVFHMHGLLCFPVDNGMKVFDYTIYAASAFNNMVRLDYKM